MNRKSIDWGRIGASACAAVTIIGCTFAGPAAKADDLRSWQDYWRSSHVMEVAQSSTSNGAKVDMWGLNASATQYWWSVYSTNYPEGNYYTLHNYNSGLLLDAYPDCSVKQYGTATKTNRLWRASKVINAASGYPAGNILINRAGCNSGGSYRDVLRRNSSSQGSAMNLTNTQADSDCHPPYLENGDFVACVFLTFVHN